MMYLGLDHGELYIKQDQKIKMTPNGTLSKKSTNLKSKPPKNHSQNIKHKSSHFKNQIKSLK